MTKWVYSFAAEGTEGKGEMKNLLGGQGANLAEMASLGLPVPPGFTITTEVCRHGMEHGAGHYPDALANEVEAALARVEQLATAKFGDATAPLLVSVRSGAPASMPGMMDTILNLGMNDAIATALGERTKNRRFALDAHR